MTARVGTEKFVDREGGPKIVKGWGVKMWLQGGGQLTLWDTEIKGREGGTFEKNDRKFLF